MLSNYWKNKQEEKGGLEELQNLYKDEVMKYKLSKAAGEHYYSAMFKPITEPITEKLEKVVKPLKQLKKLSEEQSKRMITPAPTPPAIEEPKEEDDEFLDVQEPEEDDEFEEPSPIWEYKPDEGLDIEDIRKSDFKPPSGYKDSSREELSDVIRKIGDKNGTMKRKINDLERDIESLQVKYDENAATTVSYRISGKIEEKKGFNRRF